MKKPKRKHEQLWGRVKGANGFASAPVPLDPRLPIPAPATLTPTARSSAMRLMLPDCQDGPDTLHYYRATRRGRPVPMKPLSARLAGGEVDPVTVIPKGEAVTVEVEFIVPRGEPENRFLASGVATAKHLWERRRVWGVSAGPDGSVRPTHYYIAELRVTFPWSNPRRLVDVLELLREAGAETNGTCSMHVHLDCRDVDRRAARLRWLRLRAAEPWLFLLADPARADNRFCRPRTSRGGSPRYKAVNWHAYARHGTIEVRLHHGDLHHPDRLLHFISALRFVARSKPYYRTVRSVLGNLGRFPGPLRPYLPGRLVMADDGGLSRLARHYGLEAVTP